jgi:hypothetical protein
MDMMLILFLGFISLFVLYRMYSKKKGICDGCQNKSCKTKKFDCCDLDNLSKEKKDGAK